MKIPMLFRRIYSFITRPKVGDIWQYDNEVSNPFASQFKGKRKILEVKGSYYKYRSLESGYESSGDISSLHVCYTLVERKKNG